MDVLTALQALADPNRFALFQCIRGCGGAAAYDCETGACDATEPQAIALCDVKCHVPCAPSTLTHHLTVLRDAGLVETERRGRNAYVRVRPEAMRALIGFFSPAK